MCAPSVVVYHIHKTLSYVFMFIYVFIYTRCWHVTCGRADVGSSLSPTLLCFNDAIFLVCDVHTDADEPSDECSFKCRRLCGAVLCVCVVNFFPHEMRTCMISDSRLWCSTAYSYSYYESVLRHIFSPSFRPTELQIQKKTTPTRQIKPHTVRHNVAITGHAFCQHMPASAGAPGSRRRSSRSTASAT